MSREIQQSNKAPRHHNDNFESDKRFIETVAELRLLNTAWHSNRFIFYDESLGSLMEELALWYNVDVDFLDKSLKELHFTGSLYRYDDIAVILNAIEETVNVDFKISGLRIKIDRKNK
ncbi:MAG: FecR domain-containing protein [Bacteroides xylanisolvens]